MTATVARPGRHQVQPCIYMSSIFRPSSMWRQLHSHFITKSGYPTSSSLPTATRQLLTNAIPIPTAWLNSGSVIVIDDVANLPPLTFLSAHLKLLLPILLFNCPFSFPYSCTLIPRQGFILIKYHNFLAQWTNQRQQSAASSPRMASMTPPCMRYNSAHPRSSTTH
jgi:hypothetical protein